MIIALILGRAGSQGFPGKNTYMICGHPVMEYVVMAAKESKYIDDIYISTDSEEIKDIGKKNGVKIIDRPKHLCTAEALHQDAMIHAYNYVKRIRSDIDLVVLLQCNAPFITGSHIDLGIEKLKEDSSFDSAATVSKYNMFSPYRARIIAGDGIIQNFLPDDFGHTSHLSVTSDKDSTGDVWFTDGTFIVRPKCLECIDEGRSPYPWMGRKSFAIRNDCGLDIDFEWQTGQVEWWLKNRRRFI